MLIRNLVRRLGNNHISRLGLSRVLSTSQSKNDTIAADPVGAAQSQAQSNQEENENKVSLGLTSLFPEDYSQY